MLPPTGDYREGVRNKGGGMKGIKRGERSTVAFGEAVAFSPSIQLAFPAFESWLSAMFAVVVMCYSAGKVPLLFLKFSLTFSFRFVLLYRYCL